MIRVKSLTDADGQTAAIIFIACPRIHLVLLVKRVNAVGQRVGCIETTGWASVCCPAGGQLIGVLGATRNRPCVDTGMLCCRRACRPLGRGIFGDLDLLQTKRLPRPCDATSLSLQLLGTHGAEEGLRSERWDMAALCRADRSATISSNASRATTTINCCTTPPIPGKSTSNREKKLRLLRSTGRRPGSRWWSRRRDAITSCSVRTCRAVVGHDIGHAGRDDAGRNVGHIGSCIRKMGKSVFIVGERRRGDARAWLLRSHGKGELCR